MSESSELPSSRLVALDFTEDIKRLTDEFVGREWIFAEIDRWIRKDHESFFILTGEAGIGKSAIAARLTQIRNDIAAYHFCIAGRNSTIVPGTVLRSIAAQLGQNLSGYGEALANTIKPTYVSVDVKIHVGTMTGGQIVGVILENLTLADPKQELESLLTAPLCAMPTPPTPVLILFDSLDEAFTYRPSDNLVTLLAGLDNLPSWVHIMMTTRPEERVLSYFVAVPKHVVAAESQLNRNDLRRYVSSRVGKHGLRTRLLAAPQPISPEVIIDHIAGVGEEKGLADGNFLYTKILLNDVESGVQPLDDLDALPKSLDEIYQRFLLRLAPEWVTKYQPLLAILAVAKEPLNREQLLHFGDQSARLIGGRMSATLVNLALGVLVQFLDSHGELGQEHYALFHQSLRDYLNNLSRSGCFACPPEDAHRAIAGYYLELVANDWRKCDLYGLKHLPAHLNAMGDQEHLYVLLFDYTWLQTKLTRLGVNALLADFTLNQLIADDSIWRLRRTLEQSAYVLAQDPMQLAAQLLGRLLDDKDESIKTLLDQAHTECRHPCLLPLTDSLREVRSLIHTLSGHTGPVNALAITPDGQLIVSAAGSLIGGIDNTLKVWGIVDGQQQYTLRGHEQNVNSIALSPDGQLVVSGSDDSTLKIWSLAVGQLLHTLQGHTASVRTLVVTPDGQSVVSGSDDSTLKIWKLTTGQVLHTLRGHTDGVRTVAITPDGQSIVSGSDDSTLKIWKLTTGQVLHTLCGHTDGVRTVAITPDGQSIVSGSDDSTLKIWKLTTGQVLHTLCGHTERINALAITKSSRFVISASDDHTVKVWDLATGHEVRTLQGHIERVVAIVVTPDGQRAISASLDDNLKVWDLALHDVEHPLQGHTDVIKAVKVTPDSRLAISASLDKTLKVWSLENGCELYALKAHHDCVSAIAVTPDSQLCVSGSWDKTVKIWDLASGRELRTLRGHLEKIERVTVASDGQLLISAASDGTLKVWRITDGRELLTLEGHKGKVLRIAVTPDMSHLVSASADKTLRVWTLSESCTPLILDGHSDVVSSVAITPDSQFAISGSFDKTVRLWDLDTGNQRHIFRGHTDMVLDVAVTSDGQFAISASNDHSLKLWNLATGYEEHSFEGHRYGISHISITPNDQLVVSTSLDGTAKVWEVNSGACWATFFEGEPLLNCDVASDGALIVAAGASGRVHFLCLEE